MVTTIPRSDNQNSTVTVTVRITIEFACVIVRDDAACLTVDIQGEREVMVTRSRVDGKQATERSFGGSLIITMDDGTAAESVLFDFLNPGQVRMTVAGRLFGPATRDSIRLVFHAFLP
jgi:hypothetical protein